MDFYCDCGYGGALRPSGQPNEYQCPNCMCLYEVQESPVDNESAADTNRPASPTPPSPAVGFPVVDSEAPTSRPARPIQQVRTGQRGRKMSRKRNRSGGFPLWMWVPLVMIWIIPIVTLGSCVGVFFALLSTVLLVWIGRLSWLETWAKAAVSVSLLMGSVLGFLLFQPAFDAARQAAIKMSEQNRLKHERLQRESSQDPNEKNLAGETSSSRRRTLAPQTKSQAKSPPVDPIAHLPKLPLVEDDDRWDVLQQAPDADEGFIDVGPSGSYLVGFRYSTQPGWGDKYVIGIQPIYESGNGKVLGRLRGEHVGLATDVIAPDGYAVAGLAISSGLVLDAFRITYAKVDGNAVDASVISDSELIGNQTKQLQPAEATGRQAVGIRGRNRGGKAHDFQLVSSPEAKDLGIDIANKTPVNLMEVLDVARDAERGTWVREGTMIRSPDHSGVLRLPVHAPDEYQLRVVAERVEGEGCLMFGGLKNGKQFHIAVDHKRGDWCGIVQVDGRDSGVPGNETSIAGPVLTTGQKATFIFNVTNDRIQAVVEGKAVVDWPAEYDRLSPHPGWAVKDNEAMSLVHDHSQFVIHEIELRRISGPEPTIHGEFSAIAFAGDERQQPGPRSKAIGRSDAEPFMDVAPPGGALVGLRCARADKHIVGIQPVYRTAQGDVVGQFYGQAARSTAELVAPENHSITGIHAAEFFGVVGLQCEFSPLTPGGGPTTSAWFGEGERQKTIGRPNRSYVGVYGNIDDKGIGRLGLIASGEPTALSIPDAKIGPSYDLLKTFNTDRMKIRGNWLNQNGTLLSETRNGFTHLPMLPTDEYEITMDVERIDGEGPLIFGGLMQGKRFHILIDRKDWTGIDRVAGKGLGEENETATPGMVLVAGQKKRLVFRVCKDRIQLLVDGGAIVDWAANYGQLEANPFWRPTEERALCLGQDNAIFRFHSMIFTKISGTLPRIRAAKVPRPSVTIEQ